MPPYACPLSSLEELEECYCHKHGAALKGLGRNKMSDPLRYKHVMDRRPRDPAQPAQEKIRQLYVGEGLSIQEIAARLHCAPESVSKYLRDQGIDLRPAHRPRSIRIREEDLRRLYADEGLSVRDIAGILECSKDAVYRRLQELEVERRGKARAPKLSQYGDDHIMAVLKERGYRKAAVELGVGKTTLLRYMQRRGKKSPLNDRRKTPTPKGKRFEHGS